MKPFILFLISFVFLNGSCKKNKVSNPIDQLPPETQTGANTFGCLVNGEVFIPKGSPLAGPILQSNYQLIYLNSSAGYVLGITGRNRRNDEVKSISVGFDSLNAQQGRNYKLITIVKGNAGGQYSFYPANGVSQIFQTNTTTNGELWIKKLDSINQIISGTFWFDAVTTNGQKVEVREGRFDVRYTR